MPKKKPQRKKKHQIDVTLKLNVEVGQSRATDRKSKVIRSRKRTNLRTMRNGMGGLTAANLKQPSFFGNTALLTNSAMAAMNNKAYALERQMLDQKAESQAQIAAGRDVTREVVFFTHERLDGRFLAIRRFFATIGSPEPRRGGHPRHIIREAYASPSRGCTAKSTNGWRRTSTHNNIAIVTQQLLIAAHIITYMCADALVHPGHVALLPFGLTCLAREHSTGILRSRRRKSTCWRPQSTQQRIRRP